MEGKNELLSGVNSIRGDDPPHGFFTVTRPENEQSKAPNIAAFTQPVHLPGGPVFTEVKKKRGRPRGYGLDGKPRSRGSTTLSPMPISAAIPVGGDFSGWKQPRGRHVGSVPVVKKALKLEFESLGDQNSSTVGSNFRTHVMTVNSGEDILMKIISFSRQEPHAICVLSASGSVSNVTLRQPNSPGGTLVYQGQFEIVSLSGSFTPTDTGGTYYSRTGGISVVLSEPNGRVLGGGLAGVLIARSSVQVVLGSFLIGHHREHQAKNQKNNIVPPVIPAVVNPVPRGNYGMHKANMDGDDGEDDDDDDDDDNNNNSPLNFDFSG